MQTYEVSVNLYNIDQFREVKTWCDQHTQEYDYLDDPDLPIDSGRSYPRPWAFDQSMEMPFYFFNEVDAIHFKLRWSEYL